MQFSQLVDLSLHYLYQILVSNLQGLGSHKLDMYYRVLVHALLVRNVFTRLSTTGQNIKIDIIILEYLMDISI